MNKTLQGHISPETAYVVEDYPYGFRLRCKKRYWLEHSAKKGTRMVSQTTNPKRNDTWNKPKASTYCQFGGCMFLNDDGHVTWSGLTQYDDVDVCVRWRGTYGNTMPDFMQEALKLWIAAFCAADRNTDMRTHTQIDNKSVQIPNASTSKSGKWKAETGDVIFYTVKNRPFDSENDREFMGRVIGRIARGQDRDTGDSLKDFIVVMQMSTNSLYASERLINPNDVTKCLDNKGFREFAERFFTFEPALLYPAETIQTKLCFLI